MSSVVDYMVGIAEYLAENSVMLWDPDSMDLDFVYPSTEIGIHLKDVRIHPDRIVVISPYLDLNSVVLPRRDIDFQIRTRGSQIATDCDEVADIHFKLLHRQHHLVWNGLEIARVRHTSMMTLGPDDQGRWERTDNYELITQRRV
jgi:hypothetical protein